MPDNEKIEVKRDDLTGRYMKGTVSPNPAGRPLKKDGITDLLRKFAEVKGPSGLTYKEAVVRTLWLLASSGDMSAIKLVFDRTDGLLTQQIEQLQKVMVEYVTDWDGSEPVDEVANIGAVPESD